MIIELSYILAFISIGGFIFFSLFLYASSKIKKVRTEDFSKFTPPISIIIPTYNEEAWIKSKIENILSIKYDGLKEIIVVDGGSEDKTVDTAKEFGDVVTILSFPQRRGKVIDQIEAVKHATHEIIIGTDATVVISPTSIEKMVRHFSNPRVGAVSSNLIVQKPTTYSEKVDDWIKSYNGIVRSTASRWGCSMLEGGLFAIRKNIFRELSPTAFYEDRELSIITKGMGYDVVHEEDAKAYYLSPSSIRDFRKQKRRTLFGIAQSIWKHKNLIFNPKLGVYGLIFFPEYSFWRFVRPIFFVLSIFLIIIHGIFVKPTLDFLWILLTFIGGFILFNFILSLCSSNPLVYIRKTLVGLSGAFMLLLLFPAVGIDLIKKKSYKRWNRINRKIR